jgi:hemolysin activation/secretion protein
MNLPHTTRVRTHTAPLPVLCCALLAALPLHCLAAEALPNAGSLLQNQQSSAPRPASAQIPMPLPAAAAAAAIPAGSAFLVRQLRIEGNTAFDSAALHPLISGMEGQRLTLADIGSGIDAISAHYRAAGYPLARAIVPAQTVEDGVLRIQVIEASWGRVELQNHSAVTDAMLLRTLSGPSPGAAVHLPTLERATLLLSDLPAVNPRAVLRAGDGTGVTDLVVDVQPGAPLTASALLDNHGSPYTGVARSSGNVQWNNPLGRGDTLAFSGTTSEGGGMNYARLAYEIPVWLAGMQAGLESTGLQYRLGDSAASLQASGSATQSSVWLRGSLLRSSQTNLNARLGYTNNVLRDHVDATDVQTDRTLNVWHLEFSGERSDNWLGGGMTTAGVAVYAGRVGFDNAAAAELDAAAADTADNFVRGTLALSRTQSWGQRTTVLLNLNAQWAQKNLDSSQKFSLGGPGNVRAYRSGSLSGDIGASASLELRYTLPLPERLQDTGVWQLAAFVDGAQLQTNRNAWASGSNAAGVVGAGLGLHWQGPKGWTGRASIASALGELPTQLDGSNATHSNAWLELALAF